MHALNTQICTPRVLHIHIDTLQILLTGPGRLLSRIEKEKLRGVSTASLPRLCQPVSVWRPHLQTSPFIHLFSRHPCTPKHDTQAGSTSLMLSICCLQSPRCLTLTPAGLEPAFSSSLRIPDALIAPFHQT